MAKPRNSRGSQASRFGGAQDPRSAGQRGQATGWILAATALAALIATGPACRRDPPAAVEHANVLGQLERCQTCHPAGRRGADSKAHPAVEGHPNLMRLGCTPCHGGLPLQRDESAHEPALGEGKDPFLPAARSEIGCARCHVPGGSEMPRLARGQRHFVEESCPGCHRPGAHPRSIGFDLPALAQQGTKALHQILTAPRSRLPAATMWSLRDATHGSRYADTAEGRARLDDLISYVLMLGDHPQRQRMARFWYRPQLRIDTPCSSCHRLDGQPPRQPGHRCATLRGSAELRCARCHGSPETRPDDLAALCPQMRAAFYRCGTCHLREGDGAKALVARAQRAAK